MTDKRSAINSLVTKDVEFTMKDDAITYWSDSTVTQPSEAEIDAEVKRLQAEYDANQYQRDRATDYPTWQEQMDLIYHSGVAGLKAELKKTKDKYPKG